VRGTFLLSIPFLASSIGGLTVYFYFFFSPALAIFFAASQLPATIYLAFWIFQCFRNAEKADYDHTLRMSIIATSALNIFCLIAWLVIRHGA
jgi:hypothetical protein